MLQGFCFIGIKCFVQKSLITKQNFMFGKYAMCMTHITKYTSIKKKLICTIGTDMLIHENGLVSCIAVILKVCQIKGQETGSWVT